MTTDYQQGSRDGRVGWRSAAFGDVLFGQWLPRTSTARTVDEFRRVTLAARENDEVRFVADAANGVVWRFLYLPDGRAYPWKYIGGPGSFARVAAGESTASTSAVDLTTFGPVVSVPLAGVYHVRWGARIQMTTAALSDALVTLTNSAGVNVSSNYLYHVGSSTFDAASCETEDRIELGIDSYRLRYQTSTATASTFGERFLHVTPVRVR